MRLRIEKLGRIAEADIEIRPLTVFVGPNHTNKTWAAYSAYAAAAMCSRFVRGASPEAYQAVAPLVDRVDEMRRQATTPDQRITIPREQIVTIALPPLHVSTVWLGKLLGNDTPQDAVSVVFELPSEAEPQWDALELDFKKTGQEWSLAARRLRRGVPTAEHQYTFGSRREVSAALVDARIQVFNTPIVLPTNRGTELNADELQLNGIDRDYQRALAFALKQSDRRPTLFANALGGEIAVAEQSIIFRHASGHEIRAGRAASIVRSLATIDLLVRRVPDAGDLIVIDEPEMNAHPRAQLFIAEALAKLANAGFRVLITTHSPYIVEHISNLMVASRVAESDRADLARRSPHGLCSDPAAFLNPDDVGIYAFTESQENPAVVQVRDVVDRSDGLVLGSTFGEASDDVANEYGILLEYLRDPTAK